MYALIEALKRVSTKTDTLPFSVYSSQREQVLVNVPVIKPTLICVLSGRKDLGNDSSETCQSGEFVFLSNNPLLSMRNIPAAEEYLAFILEFEPEDFTVFDSVYEQQANTFFAGKVDQTLEQTLSQFIEWSSFAPPALWPQRRREILLLLSHLGYTQVSSVVASLSLSHQIHHVLCQDLTRDISAQQLCTQLAMSESTLRRKLAAEGNSLQAIKDQARLGFGLHLIQSTMAPISQIAGQCGYLSQSRFTDKFKQRFGLTPSQLRKTRLTVLGE